MSFKEALLLVGFMVAIALGQIAQGATIQAKESAHLGTLATEQAAQEPDDEAPTITAKVGDGAEKVVSAPWTGPAHVNRVGNPVLACVGIQWSDNTYMDAAKCKGVADKVSAFYAKQSRGLFRMAATGKTITTTLPCKKPNLAAAEAQAKKEVTAYKYIIPVPCPAHGGTHASNDIAHTSQLLTWVNIHETGHLIGLGHSNAWTGDKYTQYADHSTVMGGGIPKTDLNAVQRYYLGWIPQAEVAIFDPAITDYELKSSSDVKTAAKSILFIPFGLLKDTQGPPGVIAVSDYCGATPCGRYYQWASGGSNLRAGFGSEGFTDPKTGLKMVVISKNGGITKFKITLEPVTVKVDVK